MTTDNGRQLWLQRHGKAPKPAVPAPPAPEPEQVDTTPPATGQSLLTPRAGIDPDQAQDDDTHTTGSVARGRARYGERTGQPRWMA
ncbi:hypothetical protein OG216_23575 [Streptomycetaceae bacterium NBC_01309]